MSAGTFSLDVIDVAKPCGVSWAAMKGDDRSRFCSDCRQRVYNLSSMPLEEAVAVVQRMEGRLCVRFYRRPDGTIITKDCRGGLKEMQRQLAMIATAVIGIIIVIFGFLGISTAMPGRSSHLRNIEPFCTFLDWLDPGTATQGAMCYPSSKSSPETSSKGSDSASSSATNTMEPRDNRSSAIQSLP
jgi:hypothetical protein